VLALRLLLLLRLIQICGASDGPFLGDALEPKILWKSIRVTLDSLIERACFDAIEGREVAEDACQDLRRTSQLLKQSGVSGGRSCECLILQF